MRKREPQSQIGINLTNSAVKGVSLVGTLFKVFISFTVMFSVVSLPVFFLNTPALILWVTTKRPSVV